MPAEIRVDLHCHSRHSDGALWPEQLAEYLAARGVAVAALADHDTVEGQAAFRLALSRRGIGCITAIELTACHRDREIHLLGYGFDPEHGELLATLASIRQSRHQEIASIAKDVRARTSLSSAASSVAPDGRLSVEGAITLLHRAGGKVFLAHPLTIDSDFSALRGLVGEFQTAGLDGIEAIYGAYDVNQRQGLTRMAGELELMVCAGTDFHSKETDRPPGIDMPAEVWRPFRHAVAGSLSGQMTVPATPKPRHHGWSRFVFHIIFPTGLSILLFVLTIWGFFLPTFERSLLDRKREMIRELANVTLGIVAEAHDAELQGKMTRAQAQQAAASRIEHMRYGREGKDYFWVQDSTPRIIMHPYRTDLNGHDVSEFKDPRGTRIFVEFADLVRQRKEGYVQYVWQWKDDPQRLVAKESYIRGFEPWGWIIGTGLYIDDVRQEISRIERGLVYGSLAIATTIAALLVLVVRESQHMEKQRSDAKEQLAESHQQYRSLVEATTEGTLLIVGGRCRYANSAMLRLLGIDSRQLQLMELEDVLPRSSDNAAIWEALRHGNTGAEPSLAAEGKLACADGALRPALITINPIQLINETGVALRVSQGSAPASHSTGSGGRETDAEQLIASIIAADAPERVVELCRSASAQAASWSNGLLPPQRITASLSEICDAATRQLTDLAVQRTGTPPVGFALIALGSQGRQEQTLLTDQDNAIIVDGDLRSESDREYFQQVGNLVNEWLNAAGYMFCRGEVMARNPRWCATLETWTGYFRDWIGKAEPAQLLDMSIFFDLRVVYGNTASADALRTQVNAAIAASPEFLPHFARSAIEFKAPMRLFGRIVAPEMPGKLDLKDAMMPIVSFARLYALRHGLTATNTIQRLREVSAAGALAEPTLRDLVIAHDFVTSLRLKHQALRLCAGEPMDNSIDYHQLSHIETALLRETFREIDTIQQKIRYDLLGGGA